MGTRSADASSGTPAWRFGRFRLDPERHELRTPDGPVALQPKLYALLLELVRGAGRVLGKRELLESVWGGVAVTESSLTRAVNALRTALARAGAEGEIVRTVRGRGYALAVPVTPEPGAPSAPPADPPTAPASDFVGREEELRELLQALDEAEAGRGRLALVSGDPGIGKSRLVLELARRAEARGALALWGRAGEGEGRVAYGLWMSLLQEATKGREHEVAAWLGAAVADLAAVAPWLRRDPAPAAPADPELARLRLFAALLRLLSQLAERAPLLLVVEDLHEADPASLRLLEQLAHRVARERIAVVCTVRAVGAPPGGPLEAHLAELQRAPGAVLRLELGGLPARAVAQLVERVGGSEPTRPELRALVRRTGGNPLFVREWLRLGGGLASAAGEGARLPETVRQLIGRRLAELPAACRALLELAAVAGPRFPVRLLAHASGRPLADALQDLQPAEAARILVSDGAPGRLRFTHDLYREALLGELTTLARVEAHARVGRALEATTRAEPGASLAELAHHFGLAAEGGLERERALHHIERAARDALERRAFEELAGHLERLLRLEGPEVPAPPGRRMDLLVALAEVRHRAGEPESAERTLQHVLALAAEAGSDRHAATAIVRLADHTYGSVGGVPGTRIALAEALLPRLDTEPAVQAELLVALGTDLYWVSVERSRAVNAQALEHARELGLLGVRAAALGGRYRLLTHPDDADERLRVADESEALAREHGGDPRQAFYAGYHRTCVAVQRADLAEAERQLRALARQAEASRGSELEAHVAAVRSGMALLRGDLDAAAEGAEESLRRVSGTRSGDEGFLTYVVQLGAVRLLQGRLAELAPLLDRGAARYPRMLAFRSARLAAHLQEGERERARALLASVVPPGFEGFRRDFNLGLNLALSAGAAAALGDAERAEALAAELLPYAGRFVGMDIFAMLGSGDRFLAALARTLGRREEAIERAEAALELERRAGAPLFEARTALELAALREARGGSRDRRAARELRDRAARLAAERGRGWSLETLAATALA